MNQLAQSLMIQCTGETMAGGERMCTLCDLLSLVDSIKNIAVELAIVGVIAMILYGGYTMMIAGAVKSSATEYERGKTIVKNALIGIALVLSAYLIVSEIFRIFAPGGGFAPWNAIQC